MTKAELIQYIHKAAQKKVTDLILCFEELTELPPDIRQLTHLRSLDLSFNQLTRLPPEIAQLTQLQELFLNDNQLTELPSEIGQLSLLQGLILSGNQLTQLPPAIGQLTQLQWLYLNGNRLTQLPPEIGQLTHLQRLDLSNNQLTELSPKLGQLTQLQQLNLSDNQLIDLSPAIGQLTLLQLLNLDHNQLTKIPTDIGQLTQLQVLNLRDNHLTHLPLELGQVTKFMEANINQLPAEDRYNWAGLRLQDNPLRIAIPPEILEKTYRPTEIINYYFNALTAKPLHEAKMLVVGQSGVGKTSLVNRLLYHTYHHYELQTEGIAITRWSVTTPNQETIHLNVWDFGGQTTMPATHQFFLTKRSLYVLVLDAQQGPLENRVEYWLKLIHNVGGDSPILVVINKNEELQLAFNRKGLSSKYPSIKAFFDISCKENQGLDLLNHQIAEWVDKLEHVHDPFPAAWFKIKDQLGNLPQDYLRYDDYVQLCQQEHLMDTTSQRTLLGFLHDLGIVLNFRENRWHSPLNETYILKPEWVMQGIYKIMNSKELLPNKGVLAVSQLNDLLDDHRYPSSKQHLIVEIMEQFELCFPLEERQRFLIPESLPKEPPDFHWDTQNSLAFQYHYDVLPSSIISRFMVRLHRLIHHQTYWHTGVVLTMDDNQATVTADLEDKKIFIGVTGNDNGKRALLAIIRSHFDYIHQSISKIRVTEQVPYKNTVIPYQNLLKFMEKGIYTPYLPELDEEVDVITLLGGIDGQLPRQLDKNFEDLTVELPQSQPDDHQTLQVTVQPDDKQTFRDWLWIGEVWFLLTMIIAMILYYVSKSSVLFNLILSTTGSMVATWAIILRGWKFKPSRK